MHPTLTIARRAAIGASKIILRHYENLDRITINAKRRNDLVSEVDVQAEREIVQILRRTFPDHAILGEEGGQSGSASDDHQWLIDPLDGTTNYLHGLPLFCISIAYRQRGRLESGLIYDPLRDEFFTASRGGGAQMNDRRIRVTPRLGLEGALLSVGLPPWKVDQLQGFLSVTGDLIQQGAVVRRTGSAALDLAYVACGRLDGFWEMGLNPWDIGAGALLVQEAGGLVSDFVGGHDYLHSGNVVTGNPKIFKALLKTIHAHRDTLEDRAAG